MMMANWSNETFSIGASVGVSERESERERAHLGVDRR